MRKGCNGFMKFELNDRLIGRIIGISMAAAVAVTVSMASEILNIKDINTINENDLALAENNYSKTGATTIINFADAYNNSNEDTGKLHDIYNELVKSESKKNDATGTTPKQVTASTTASQTIITTTTDISSKKSESEPTSAKTAPAVSNNKREFNYDDVSLIAADLKTLQNFVEELNPTSFCWDTSDYEKYGYVKISLISAYGNVTLDVKPVNEYTNNMPYLIDNEISGSVSGSSITEWDWYNQNKNGGCNICSVTWLAEEFAIEPVRDIKLGTKLADLTDSYLCVNGGATTLYKASDVVTDQIKLNELLLVENAYTFVGGRVYDIHSYIEKYYEDKVNSYRFADSDFVVQYGCNSIMNSNYTTGSWIIEYAIKDDVVVGITFMNKSYYESASIDQNNDTVSTTSSTTAFEHLFGE